MSQEDKEKLEQASLVVGAIGGVGVQNWIHTSDDTYVCFLQIDQTNYPVTAFTIESSTSSQFSIEVFFLSKDMMVFEAINEKSATLKMFFNEYTRQYEKEVTAYIRKFYNQGSAFLIPAILFSNQPDNYFLYKVILYPNLYKLTLKTHNRIFKKNEENDTLNVAKDVLNEYHIDFLCAAECVDIRPSITQYQETDYNFVMRMLEEANCIGYYNFSETLPKFTIIQNSTAVSGVAQPKTITKPIDIKHGYKEGELISIFVDQDHFFKAKVCSCQLFAGDCFNIGFDLSAKYFIVRSFMRLEYINNIWAIVNEVEGFIVHQAKNYLIKTRKRPSIPGIIRGVVVSDMKDTFHVNDYGEVQVRLLWHLNSIESEGDDSEFSSSNKNEKEVSDSWDINHEEKDITTWAPVSQWGSSGDSFGNYNLPRAGQEVLVWFYQGNPDRPVVIGTVYNKSNTFPNVTPSSNEVKNDLLGVYNVIGDVEGGIVNKIELKTIASDHPNVMPDIKSAAPNVVFKHYSYDSEKGTKSDRFNEISLFNNFNEEKLHIKSSNLIDIRSGNEMHVLVRNMYRSVYQNQLSTVNEKRDFYIFGEDSYNILDADRYNFFLSLSGLKSNMQQMFLKAGSQLGVATGQGGDVSEGEDLLVGDKKGNITEAEMVLIKACKTQLAKTLLSPYLSGGSFELSIYDLAIKANMFFAGKMINLLVMGSIDNICAFGHYKILTNEIDFTAIGEMKVACYGQYSVKVVGLAALSFTSFFSMRVSSGAEFKFGSMKLKCGDSDSDFGKVRNKYTQLVLDSPKNTFKFAQCAIKGVDMNLEYAQKLNIKCGEFVLNATKISLVSASEIQLTSAATFVIKAGAKVALGAPLIQLG